MIISIIQTISVIIIISTLFIIHNYGIIKTDHITKGHICCNCGDVINDRSVGYATLCKNCKRSKTILEIQGGIKKWKIGYLKIFSTMRYTIVTCSLIITSIIIYICDRWHPGIKIFGTIILFIGSIGQFIQIYSLRTKKGLN